MGKPKKHRHKHKSLSSETSIELPGENSGMATDSDGMDDFEKEAMEGFSKFSTPEKTKAMVEEINLAISKRTSGASTGSVTAVAQQEEPGKKKNRIIWFSAAASVVLLILISVFFLNESKNDTVSTMAMNDITPPPTVQPTLIDPTTDPKEAVPLDEANKPAGQAAAGKSKEELKQGPASRMETEDTKPGEGIANDAVAETKTLEESEKTNKGTSTYNTYKANTALKDADFKKSEPETADKLAAVKPSANAKIKTETATGYASSSVGSNSSSAPVTTEQNANSLEEVTIASKNKKSKTRERSAAYESELDQEVEVASYKGGEGDIKAYVEAYLQKMSLAVTGKYKVKANVLTNGKLKVKFVNHITNEVCKDCENSIKKALSDMTGWTPAMWGKTASESSVDFVLSF